MVVIPPIQNRTVDTQRLNMEIFSEKHGNVDEKLDRVVSWSVEKPDINRIVL